MSRVIFNLISFAGLGALIWLAAQMVAHGGGPSAVFLGVVCVLVAWNMWRENYE